MWPPSPKRKLDSFIADQECSPESPQKGEEGRTDGHCPPGGEGWVCWFRAGSEGVAELHTATCNDLLLSSMANIVPVLTWPEDSGSGSASREQPAKGKHEGTKGA